LAEITSPHGPGWSFALSQRTMEYAVFSAQRARSPVADRGGGPEPGPRLPPAGHYFTVTDTGAVKSLSSPARTLAARNA
jgi:hypothetical protein